MTGESLLSWWPRGYQDSRECFLEHAQGLGATVESYPLVSLAPDADPLHTDTASMLSVSDRHRIIIVSGLHGVEAYAGAAVQVAFLKKLAESSLLPGTGIVLIHAANPWGYACDRRVDENNVDLNRNFLNFNSEKATTHPLYHQLDKVLNPAVPPGLLSETAFRLHVIRLLAQHKGGRSLAEPVASGQCSYPQGLFYTGVRRSASSALLQSLIAKVSQGAERLTVLDLHSGLGDYGVPMLIVNTNRADNGGGPSELHEHFGVPLVFDRASTNAYNARGSLSQWCQRQLNHKQYTYACVEFGTYKPLKVLSALKRENQAYHWASHNSREFQKAAALLKEVFSPGSQSWRQRVVNCGLEIIDRAMR